MRDITHRTVVILLATLILCGAWWVPADAQEALAATTATAFVTGLYQQVLGRTPDTLGLAAWVAQIQ